MLDNEARNYRRYYTGNSYYRQSNTSRLVVKSQIKTRLGIVVIASFVALCLIGVMIAFSFWSGDERRSSLLLVNEPPVETHKPLPVAIDDKQLQSQLEAIIAENPQLDIGISVQDLATKSTYTYGVDLPFIAASVGKIITASLYLDRVEKGEYTLEQNIGSQTARIQIQKMIAISDNDAWHALNDELTRPSLEEYARNNGITSYSAETNTIKPSDVSLFLSKLYQKQLLNEDDTSFLLANMRQDQEEIQFIRKYISPEINVYHKAGWLSDRAHDTAIVENGDRPYVLVIFTKARYGNYDFSKGQQIFSKATTSVHTVMTQ